MTNTAIPISVAAFHLYECLASPTLYPIVGGADYASQLIN